MRRSVFCDGVRNLADRYEAFILDQWGVLHDGTNAYPGVHEVLHHLAEGTLLPLQGPDPGKNFLDHADSTCGHAMAFEEFLAEPRNAVDRATEKVDDSHHRPGGVFLDARCAELVGELGQLCLAFSSSAERKPPGPATLAGQGCEVIEGNDSH